jgi:transglutaminase/protease-like cytokinesis protein 3
VLGNDGLSWGYLDGKSIQARSMTQMIEMDNKGIAYSISDSGSSKMQRVKQSMTKARAILKDIIEPDMTDAEKLKAVHDYIVLNTAYDYDNYKNDTVPEESYTEYGVLFKGVAVCDGYARTTKLFLDLLGIENYYVAGEVLDGGLHAWNVVKIDDKYVQVDTTWDDPVPNRPGEVRYDYFMVTDTFMSKSREWYDGQAPAAN